MRKSTIILSLVLLSGCVQENTPAANTSYVSTAQYQNYNCKQIAKEMQRISKKLEAQPKGSDALGAVLGTAVTAYGMSQGYGFYDEGTDNTENNRLISLYDALEQLSIQKNCN